MILTDDNCASIECAVEEGRSVYKNLLKAISFIFPVNGGESMTILLSTLLGRELPILSLQILWLNMLNSITMTKNFLMVQAPGLIRGINPKSKIENPQAPAFIRGVNLKSKI